MAHSTGFDPEYLDVVPTACIAFHVTEQSLFCNPEALHLFGYGPADRLMLEPDSLLHPDDRAFTAHLLGDLATGKPDHATAVKRCIRSDGSTFWGSFRFMPVWVDGRIHSIVAVITPVQLPSAGAFGRDQAVPSRIANAEEFVASVGHELRAPMHSVIGLAELLAGSDTLDRTDQKLAQAILDQASGISGLVDDLLEYSKSFGEAVRLTLTQTSPAEIVANVVDILADQTSLRDVDVTVTIKEDAPATIVSDRLRIQQILTNLLSNAIRFSRHGLVTIQVESLLSGQVRFIVSDDGAGIPTEMLPFLFEPFVQGHTTDTGSGLGLAISKRLTRALGGSITVKSEVGEGSVFTVVLPIGPVSLTQGTSGWTQDTFPANGAEPAATGAIERHTTESSRVLVVEDEEVNQLLATSQLDRLGYRNDVATTGLEAVTKIREAWLLDDPFRAVLMDWRLPGIDGLETTRLIRLEEDERRSEQREDWCADHLPIIGVSANAMAGDRERCIDSGMDDFLAKPVGITTLAHALDTWIYPLEPSVDVALLDPSVLLALESDLGDSEAGDRLLRTFLDGLDGRLEPMKRSLRRELVDRDEIARSIHSLKSTTALLGSPMVADACQQVERFLASYPVGETQGALDERLKMLLRLTDRLDVEIRDHLT